jgi:hypothetical protein
MLYRSRLHPDPGDPVWAAGRDAAVAAAMAWFEGSGGWAPPDTVTLAEWMADGVCRCPDDCLVAPDAWCGHGLASWWLILSAPRRSGPLPAWDPTLMLPSRARLDLTLPGALAVIEAHEHAADERRPTYPDPATGYVVITAPTHWRRGRCCGSGCRHCPYLAV